MKRILLSLFLSLSLFPGMAFAETITDFKVDATLSAERQLTVQEKITYDFEDYPRHGIYRIVPIRYSRNGGNYQLRLKVLDVERDGKSEPFSQSSENGELTLKIGDADALIQGSHQYVIKYQTDRAINFFSDHDELYWNVTGNGWDEPIEQAAFSLAGPQANQTACFTGAYGSEESACDIVQKNGAIMASIKRVLDPSEGFTVVIGFPKGALHQPTVAELIWQILSDNGVLLFPLVAFIVMFGMWWKRGRDPKLGTVIPEYEAPEKLDPAVTGAAMTDGSVPERTTTATIIDLARRGYLKIRFGEDKKLLGTKQTFTFVKQKEADSKVTSYEKDLLDGLFQDGDERKLEDLQGSKFYVNVLSFKKHVQESVNALSLFDANPNATRGAYLVTALVVGWGLYFFFGSTGLGVLSAICTGIVIGSFGIFMPRRNAKGIKMLADIKGFKWFLSVTEKDRMDFHNAPERTPEQFQTLLPFAIVFGVENKWAEQFASLNLPPPSWADGSTVSNWNTIVLVSHINSMHTAASSAAYSAPSSAGSGGSGFSGGGSGGGFGGGGGGSW